MVGRILDLGCHVEMVVSFEFDRQIALLSWLLAASYLRLFETSYWFLILRREDRDITPIWVVSLFLSLLRVGNRWWVAPRDAGRTGGGGGGGHEGGGGAGHRGGRGEHREGARGNSSALPPALEGLPRAVQAAYVAAGHARPLLAPTSVRPSRAAAASFIVRERDRERRESGRGV